MEISSQIKTDTFSRSKAMLLQKSAMYLQTIEKLLVVKEVSDDDHIYFLWILLYHFVFEPLGGRFIVDVFMIAKTLAVSQALALGTILLANMYQRLSRTVTEEPLPRLRGGVWLFQMWLLTCFPHFATDKPKRSKGHPSSTCVIIVRN
ncbi:hypothetical protein M5689_010840 [Euphorbia peplus]|nr:hypothetical protein M5689_010840 [Euphorbia peplus]